MMFRFIAISFVFLLCNSVIAGDYPKSREERERDEMGSLAGGEGVVWKPSKEKSTSTKTEDGEANKHLYQAALDILKFAPLLSADKSGGTIITEWYGSSEQKNTQFKITVYIQSDVIATEDLEVIAFQRKRNSNGQWADKHEESPIAMVIKDKIINKARALYQESIKKNSKK